MSRLAERVANGCFQSLAPHVKLLRDSRQTKIGVRVNIHPDDVSRNVCFLLIEIYCIFTPCINSPVVTVPLALGCQNFVVWLSAAKTQAILQLILTFCWIEINQLHQRNLTQLFNVYDFVVFSQSATCLNNTSFRRAITKENRFLISIQIVNDDDIIY